MKAVPLLRVEDLEKHFPVMAGVIGRVVGQVKAVDGVSFEIEAGTTLGLVGESGCGKTTVGQTLLRLLEPTGGRVWFDGQDVASIPQDVLRKLRRDMQIIFQDPFNSLNPRMTVADIVGEAMRVHGLATRNDVEEKVGRILERVGIPSEWMNRYPHEFSGGQRQRISVARAIALEPRLIVCDEAVSALDVSIQAQVINLLIGLQKEMGLSYLFISHDLSVVKHISDRIAVMYLGQIVETAPSAQLFRTPAHPYTRALLSAIPIPDPTRRPERIVLEGDVPTPLDPPPGCHFHTRCPAAMERCGREEPPTYALPGEQSARCFLAEDLEGEPDWHAVLRERTDRAEAERVARRSADASSRTAPAPSPNDAVATGSSVRSARSADGRTPAREVERIEESHALRRALGAGGLAMAAALLLGGWPFSGALLALVVFGLAFSSGFTAERRLVAALALVAAIGVLGLGGVRIAAAVSERAAERQLEALTREIDAFAAERGRLPTRLRELGWRLPPIVGSAAALDPWGRPWHYHPPSREGGLPWLGSAGADGIAGTADDVGRVPVAPR